MVASITISLRPTPALRVRAVTNNGTLLPGHAFIQAGLNRYVRRWVDALGGKWHELHSYAPRELEGVVGEQHIWTAEPLSYDPKSVVPCWFPFCVWPRLTLP